MSTCLVPSSVAFPDRLTSRLMCARPQGFLPFLHPMAGHLPAVCAEEGMERSSVGQLFLHTGPPAAGLEVLSAVHDLVHNPGCSRLND